MPTKWIAAVIEVSTGDFFWSIYDTEEKARADYEEDMKNPAFKCVTLAKVVSSASCE